MPPDGSPVQVTVASPVALSTARSAYRAFSAGSESDVAGDQLPPRGRVAAEMVPAVHGAGRAELGRVVSQVAIASPAASTASASAYPDAVNVTGDVQLSAPLG